MAKYVCSVCGFIYDEAKGIPEAGVAAGTKWDELPEDWLCPLCGAAKSEFEKEKAPQEAAQKKPMPISEKASDMKEMSALELSALCSNLARGCEKQYKAEEAALFAELSDYFKGAAAPAEDASLDKLIALIEKDLDEGFPHANAAATHAHDRGALRALTWSEKVTRMLKSLSSRYRELGDKMLENSGVYVCTICGFVYIGDELPEVCPVCKVPNWKFEEIEGGKTDV